MSDSIRFKYSTLDPSQDEFDSLPRLEFVLQANNRSMKVLGLVDSGATINVLPYKIGMELGSTWEDRKANIRLAGNLDSMSAIPLFANAQIEEFPPVRLAFAWVKSDHVPLILGQTNSFMEFDVCFYRSRLEFEVRPTGLL